MLRIRNGQGQCPAEEARIVAEAKKKEKGELRNYVDSLKEPVSHPADPPNPQQNDIDAAGLSRTLF